LKSLGNSLLGKTVFPRLLFNQASWPSGKYPRTIGPQWNNFFGCFFV